MKTLTRKKYEEYCNDVAKLNGVSSAGVQFAVEPTAQQKLEDKMGESSSFLDKINVVPVDELVGQKLGLGVPGTIASNTDTDSKDRETREVFGMDDDEYQCRKNDFDTHISYKTLDSWAKFNDFQKKIRNHEIKAQARDRCMIALNGTSYAKNSNRTTNPLLQDVNIGFLEKYRTKAAARVMKEGKAGDGKVNVFAGGHYENIDAMVFDAVNNLLDPWHRADSDLVVMLSRDLLADKYFPILNKAQPNTETLAADMIISQKRVGGLPAAQLPFMPEGTMLITSFDNLSLYYQEGGRRRHLAENPKRSRIENYESSNDAYVVEDYGRGCLIENIVTKKPA